MILQENRDIKRIRSFLKREKNIFGETCYACFSGMEEQWHERF